MGVKDLVTATIAFQRLFFFFLLILQKILLVSYLGFLTAKRLALSFRYTRFGIESFKAERTWSLVYYRLSTVLLKEKYCNSLSVSIIQPRNNKVLECLSKDRNCSFYKTLTDPGYVRSLFRTKR